MGIKETVNRRVFSGVFLFPDPSSATLWDGALAGGFARGPSMAAIASLCRLFFDKQAGRGGQDQVSRAQAKQRPEVNSDQCREQKTRDERLNTALATAALARSLPPGRIGVVGAGNFGRLHARTIQTLDSGVELGALIDPGRGAADTLEAAFPGVPFFSELTPEAVGSCDGFVIASSSASHIDVAETLLLANKKVRSRMHM